MEQVVIGKAGLGNEFNLAARNSSLVHIGTPPQILSPASLRLWDWHVRVQVILIYPHRPRSNAALISETRQFFSGVAPHAVAFQLEPVRVPSMLMVANLRSLRGSQNA